MFNLLFNLNFNIAIIIMSAGSFLFNILVLRLRKTYYPMNIKYAVAFMLIPCLNLTFLAMNVVIGCMNIGCYTVRKKRMTKATYNYHKNRVSKKAA